MKIKNMLSLAIIISAAIATTTFCWMFDIKNMTQLPVNGEAQFDSAFCRNNKFTLQPGQGFRVGAGICNLNKVTVFSGNQSNVFTATKKSGGNPKNGLNIIQDERGTIKVVRR